MPFPGLPQGPATRTESIRLKAEYYDNPNLEGEPRLTRVDPAVDWVWTGPTPLTGQWSDPFSVRWTGLLVPPISERTISASTAATPTSSISTRAARRIPGWARAPALTKTIELQAGRLYRLRLDYRSWDLNTQVAARVGAAGRGSRGPGAGGGPRGRRRRRRHGPIASHRRGRNAGPDRCFAGGDRTDIALPEPQEALLKRLVALGRPLVLVLLNGGALAVNWAAGHVPAIVEAWYPGQAGGEALADILFGSYTPGAGCRSPFIAR